LSPHQPRSGFLRPVCPVEVRNGDVWVKTTFGYADALATRRLGRRGAAVRDYGTAACRFRSADRKGAPPRQLGQVSAVPLNHLRRLLNYSDSNHFSGMPKQRPQLMAEIRSR
jgi:hypothetical protein